MHSIVLSLSLALVTPGGGDRAMGTSLGSLETKKPPSRASRKGGDRGERGARSRGRRLGEPSIEKNRTQDGDSAG